MFKQKGIHYMIFYSSFSRNSPIIARAVRFCKFAASMFKIVF